PTPQRGARYLGRCGRGEPFYWRKYVCSLNGAVGFASRKNSRRAAHGRFRRRSRSATNEAGFNRERPVGSAVRALLLTGAILCFLVAAAALFGMGGVLGDSANMVAGSELERPGIGIRSAGILNLVLAYALVLMLLDFIPAVRTVTAKVQGIVTLIL